MPTDPQAHRWHDAMLAGDFQSAWVHTDLLEQPRRKSGLCGPENLLWDGSSFRDRHVVIRALHGLGDTIQYLRFIPDVLNQARRVTTLVQPEFLPLLRVQPRNFGDLGDIWIDWHVRGEVEIEIMELAYALRVDISEVHRQVPYLTSTSRFEWDQHGQFRVGLIWRASSWDESRSIPLRLLKPLFATGGISFFALQQNPEPDEMPPELIPISHRTRSLALAAAAISGLDLLITVDTMAAHLAGALGCKAWVLLQNRADWRWMAQREDSPWYPSVRLYRQPSNNAWEPVVQRVTEDLERLR